MAFGRKKSTTDVKFDQSNVFQLASRALAQRRSTFVRLALRITATGPILMHRWAPKAILQMVGKMVGQPMPRVDKDLTEEYEDSYYRNEAGLVVLPCRIIKASIVDGYLTTGGIVSKADLKRYLRVLGYTSPIHLNGEMQMDVRPVGTVGSVDMRARAVIPVGSHFDVVLQFTTMLTPDRVMAACEGAGEAIGLCDWRPDKGGDHGTFSIAVLPEKEIPRILKACSSPEDEYKIPPEFLRAFRNHAKAATASDVARKAAAVVEKVNGEARGKARARSRDVHTNGVS
jgi:hypothetical protein